MSGVDAVTDVFEGASQRRNAERSVVVTDTENLLMEGIEQASPIR